MHCCVFSFSCAVKHLIAKGDADAEREQRLGGQQPVRVEVLVQGLRKGPLSISNDCVSRRRS